MSPFYAHAIQEDGVDIVYRGYTITFASRDYADEWWRALVKQAAEITTQNPSIGGIKRITPQYYTFPKGDFSSNALISFQDKSGFQDRVFFTKLPWDRLNVIPDANTRDHVNLQTYFIRSKRDHSIYWWVDKEGQVKASDTERAKFCISIQEDDTANDTTIMIGSDMVSITAIFNAAYFTLTPNAGSNSGGIGTNANLELEVSSEPDTYPFSYFKNGFEIASIATLDNSASSMAIIQVDGDGEAWELV